MKKNLTELVFILDRSGSMCGLEEDTIGGFNGMIKKQKKCEGDANVTAVLFDDEYSMVYDHEPINNVPELTEKEYFARGTTALYDAVGKTISHVKNYQKNLTDGEKAEKVIFVIITDGFENASEEYNQAKIKKMIEKRKEKSGWEFLFLGANMDAAEEAGKIGIQADRAATYENTEDGLAYNYEVVEQTIGCLRSAPKMSDVDGSWKEKLQKHNKH